MDEKVKQRIIGGAVLIALVAIFVPFMLHDKQPDMKVSKSEFQAPPPPAQPTATGANQPSTSEATTTIASATPTDAANPSAELQAPKGTTEVTSADNQAVTFETEASAETPATQSSAATSPSTLPAETNTSSQATGTGTQNATLTATTPAATSPQPTAKAKPTKTQTKSINKTTGASSTASKKGWFVQLGTFSRAGNAKALQKKLSAKGYPNFVQTSKNAKGATVIRLYAGPKSNRAQAVQMQKQLQKTLKVNGIVVSFRDTRKSSSTKG